MDGLLFVWSGKKNQYTPLPFSQAGGGLGDWDCLLSAIFLPVLRRQVARAFADMHDTPVRMLAKGVIRSIVPWSRARAFFATRLRRRLTEETLVGHVQSTDASVSRDEALATIRGWFAQASMPPGSSGSSPMSWSAQIGASSPIHPSSSANAARWERAGVERPTASLQSPAGEGSPSLFLSQQTEDSAFLEWSESSVGRSLIAAELRSLRSRSASRIVSGVLGTEEGKEGLFKSLQAASRRDPVFAMQLRMALNDGSIIDRGLSNGQG